MQKIATAIERIAALKEDDRVPGNVKDTLDEVIAALEDEDDELSVRINSATALLDQVSNDPNIAQHTRTEIWNIASMLESAANGN